MKAAQSLRRPANWQDFESLCKKLWGEIWNCPDIRKNGRSGNNQHGVDVYGIPLGETQYYGIQCKGKDEYTDKQFSEGEITSEIEKAKTFLPPLKKYYLATTVVKNEAIEQFVRQKNVEHIHSGLFSIEFFAWEDIVELIDENQRTHDWYVKNQHYKTQKSVSVTFQNGTTEIICLPKYKKTITRFIQKYVPPASLLYVNKLANSILNRHQMYGTVTVAHTPFFSTKINLSYFSFSIRIHNTGTDPIEEYKLLLEFQGQIQDLTDTNKKSSGILGHINAYVPTTYLWADSLAGEVVPKTKILVSDDTLTSDEIFVKSQPVESKVVINWKLLSKDFKDEGQLIINVQPDIETEYNDILVDDLSAVKVIEGEIEEYILEKK